MAQNTELKAKLFPTRCVTVDRFRSCSFLQFPLSWSPQDRISRVSLGKARSILSVKSHILSFVHSSLGWFHCSGMAGRDAFEGSNHRKDHEGHGEEQAPAGDLGVGLNAKWIGQKEAA